MADKPEGKEVELAAALVRYLQWCGHEVHQEVKFGERVADLVVRQGRLLHVIECKVSLGFAVIDQAIYWTSHAHLASVAVPHGAGRSRQFSGLGHAARGTLARFGVGLWRVSPGWEEPDAASAERDRSWGGTPGWHYLHGVPSLEVAPAFHRPEKRWRGSSRLEDSLNEHTLKHSTAGAQAGHVWTPFKRTCAEVLRVVTATPGMTTKEMVKALTFNHYHDEASARGNLVQWAKAGRVPGVKLEGPRPLKWYPIS